MTQDISKIPPVIFDQLYVTVTDVENRIIFITDCYAKFMGYDPEELIGLRPSIFRSPEMKNIPIIEVLHASNYWSGVLKNSKRSGETVYFNANIYKDFDEYGNHIGYHSIHTNITKTITNPHKFIFENELLTTLLAGNDETVLVCLEASLTNASHRIVEIGSELADFIHMNKDEIIRQDLTITDIVSSKCKYYKNLELFLNDFNSQVEIIVFFDSNTSIKFRVTAVKFNFNNNAAHPAMLLKLTNITKEIKITKQLDDIISSKNMFLANLSHEIKTPLNAVYGFLTLLKDREDNDEKLEFLNIIANNVKNVIDLANDAIDFSGLDNNSLEIVPHKFTPTDIQSTIELFFARSLEKNIEFTVFISPQLPEVMMQDILRLKQIIANLISNALKFVSDNTGIISIDCHFYHGDFCFIIEDNGIGMSQNQLKRIFDPFSQASKDIKMTYGGTGLGLAVVKRIIEAMGGDISVESELGKGSIFTINIPVKVIKEKSVVGKFNAKDIFIYSPSFSMRKEEILKKYLVHFVNSRIHKIHDLEQIHNVKDSILVLNMNDISMDNITRFSHNNKVIAIKKMNVVVDDYINNKNVSVITLPLIGSKIYDALNLLFNNVSKSKNSLDFLDIPITGNILVADDSEQNILLIQTLLNKDGVHLDIATNGGEAFKKYEESIENNKSFYDLVLLDMNMPILTGDIVAFKIREKEKNENIDRIPLVALTADRYSSKDVKMLENMDDYLPKPIMLNKLLAIIAKYTNISNVVKVEENGFDKVGKLKMIRDNFMKGILMKHDITNEFLNNFENDQEKKILQQIKKLKDGEKEKFNKLYNGLLKLIRVHG